MANTEGWLQGQGLRQTAGDMLERVKSAAGEAGKWGKGFMSGLRGQSTASAPEVGGVAEPLATPETAPAPRAQPATAGGAGGAKPPGSWTTSMGAAEGPQMPPRTPDLTIETPEQTAQRLGKAATASPVEPKAPSARMAGLRSGAKLPGYLAAGAELLDPNTRAAIDPTSGMSGADRLKQAARVGLRVGGSILGGAAGGAAGTFGATPGVGTVVGGLAGGTAGYQLGDKAADWLVGTAPQAQAAPGSPPPPLSQQPVQTGSVPTSQGPQTPAQVIEGNAVPNPGNGAFQQAGQPAQGLRATRSGYDQTQVGQQPDMVYQYLDRLAKLDEGAKPGTAGAGSLAAIGALGAINRQRTADQQMGLRTQVANNNIIAKNLELQRQDREFRRQVQGDNQKGIDNEIEQLAAQGVGEPGMFKTAGDHKAAVDAAKSKLGERFRYSAADSGFDPRDMNSQQRQQLFQAMKIQDKVEAARSGVLQSAADYFGDKRVDSKNAYSYLPEKVEKATRPGESWIVTMKNGNRIALGDMVGGQFRILGPNAPVDADLMALINPLIAKAQQKAK